MATMLSPRPLPARRLPVMAGALVVAFSLPVFDRVGIHEPTLRGSGVVAFGMMTRGIVVMLVALVLAVNSPDLALAGALVYAFAYSVELALSLVLYFGGRPVQ